MTKMKIPWRRKFSNDEIANHLTADRNCQYMMNEDYNQGHAVGEELAAIYSEGISRKEDRKVPDDRRDMDLTKLPFIS